VENISPCDSQDQIHHSVTVQTCYSLGFLFTTWIAIYYRRERNDQTFSSKKIGQKCHYHSNS